MRAGLTAPGPGRATALLAAMAPVVALEFANGFYGPALLRVAPTAFWLADALCFVMLPLLAVGLLWRFAGLRPADYGFRRDAGIPRIVAATVAAYALFWLASDPLRHMLIRWLGAGPPLFSYGALVRDAPVPHAFVVAYLALSAALTEELVFRGLAVRLAEELRAPRWAYVIASSLLFAVVHWEQGMPGVGSAFVVGVAAALIYLRVGSLWPLVLAHAAVDAAHFW